MENSIANTVSIAVVSNPFSVLMANQILFNSTQSDIKILIIDYGNKKESFLNEINKCAKKQNWDKIINLSEQVDNSKNAKPSFSKRLTRKYKNFPIIKSIHGVFQKKLLNKIENEIEQKLTTQISDYTNSLNVNLFLLTQTYTNAVLIKLMPKAKLNYFEHGIGDYSLATKLAKSNGINFYGLFSNEFKNFNKNASLNFINIEFNEKPISKTITNSQNNNSILIIFQNLEIYSLTTEFWKNYLGDIIKNEGVDKVYLIKPHPLQSNETISFIEQFFSNQNIKFKFLPNSNCMELEFEEIYQEIIAVYSPFSSSLFYLSKIYKYEKIKFYYSIERVQKSIGNSPKQYKTHYNDNYPIIKNVFGINCNEFE